jgi:hypothetical protein
MGEYIQGANGEFEGSEPGDGEESGGGFTQGDAGGTDNPFAATGEASNASVVSYYVGGNLNEANAALRTGGEVSPEESQVVERLDAAFTAQEPTSSNAILYRGISGMSNDATNYSQLEVGSTFADPGFVSTVAETSNIQEAPSGMTATIQEMQDYIANKETPRDERAGMIAGPGGQLIEIHAPAGSVGIDVPTTLGDTATFSDQHEVILPRGSEFQVVSQLSDRTVVNLVPSK